MKDQVHFVPVTTGLSPIPGTSGRNSPNVSSQPGECATCGNLYDQPIEVKIGQRVMLFDSFECAIHALAPVCARCGCRVIGHGVQSRDAFYCGAHCARFSGVTGIDDRVD